MSDAEIFGEKDINDLTDMFRGLAEKADNLVEALQSGADEFIRDLKKLPSPRSNISKGGYTHLLDSFASKKEGETVLVGWGKYYGPMVEGGTKKMSARPHFKSTWKRNEKRYYTAMTNKLIGG